MDEAMFEKYAQHLEWEDFEEEVSKKHNVSSMLFRQNVSPLASIQDIPGHRLIIIKYFAGNLLGNIDSVKSLLILQVSFEEAKSKLGVN